MTIYSPYRYQCFVPFHLADPAGILFFGHAFTLFHQAFEHFIMDQLAYSWIAWFQNPEWIIPIKCAEAHYLLPLHAGQECLVELSLHSFSQTSFTLISSLQQQEPCCSLKTVHVFCNRSTRQKMPIPQEILTCFQNLVAMPQPSSL